MVIDPPMNPTNKNIVGMWRDARTGELVEFLPDGTAVGYSGAMSASYDVTSADTLRLRYVRTRPFSRNFELDSCTYRFSGDELLLSCRSGKQIKLVRTDPSPRMQMEEARRWIPSESDLAMLRMVENYWDEVFTKFRKCGDSYYVLWKGPYGHFFSEYHGAFKVNVGPGSVTTNDRMNGLQWRGSTSFSAAPYRDTFGKSSQWNEWTDLIGRSCGTEIVERAGHWSLDEDSCIQANKPSCDQIPR